jgi:ferric-dicitrate binding protein FerR (iron transport regulator)
MIKITHLFAGGLTAVLLPFVAVQPSRADNHIGSVERIQGDVSIVHGGKTSKATVGQPIDQKDQLLTGADARLLVKLSDDTEVALGENAEATITDYEYIPGKTGLALVGIKKGAFEFVTGQMSEVADKRIEVLMHQATLTAKGTAFWGGPTGNNTEGVAVFEGTVEVKNAQGSVILVGAPTRFGAARFRAGITGIAVQKLGVNPEGTTLTVDLAPSNPVKWPDDKTKRALDIVAFKR